MKIQLYSHRDGERLVDKKIKEKVLNILETTNFKIQEGCGNQLRKAILTQLKNVGWSDDFKVDINSQISLTSINDNHVLCFQTGNMSRFYADLLKLQYVFKNEKAKAAFYLIPVKEAARKMGSNIAHFERFTQELNLFEQIISIPILVIGLN